jgi:hypothetical protein
MCLKHCLSQHVCSTKRLSLPQASRIMQARDTPAKELRLSSRNRNVLIGGRPLMTKLLLDTAPRAQKGKLGHYRPGSIRRTSGFVFNGHSKVTISAWFPHSVSADDTGAFAQTAGGRIQCNWQVVHKSSSPAPVSLGFLPSQTRPRMWSTTISLFTMVTRPVDLWKPE